MTTNVMITGRQADSARRRQRVLHAITSAQRNQTELSVAAIARTAGVDRSFLYRHRDLLTQIHTTQAYIRHDAAPTDSAAVTRASLQTELANAHGQVARQATHIRQLERRLSELLGDNAWRQAGLGPPIDVDTLQQRITLLEQRIIDLTAQLEDRSAELDAARAANRELITNLNRRH